MKAQDVVAVPFDLPFAEVLDGGQRGLRLRSATQPQDVR